MKTRIAAILIAAALILGLSACSSSTEKGTASFTDSAGRTVELPGKITKVAPSGAVATMILATLCPDYLVSVGGAPTDKQAAYLPKRLSSLPVTGQLYGSKSTINLEELINAGPQLIIDLGDKKEGIAADMDALQKQTGITTIFLEADLDSAAEAYRSLGKILGLEERAEAIASFIDETVSMASKNAAKIGEGDRISVMYTSGESGLNTDARGSVQAQVIELIGAENAIVVDDVTNKGGGNVIDMEQLYNADPEVIIFAGGSIYETVANDSAWAGLKAVKDGRYYEIPMLPYNWMSNPPSINMTLGVWWLGNLLYPDIYDYDMVEKTKEIYKLLWNYDMSDDEARTLLARSTLKNAG